MTGSTDPVSFFALIPLEFRNIHVQDFGVDFQTAWLQLHRALCLSAREQGFWFPRLLRASPRDDLQPGELLELIAKINCFSTGLNAQGGTDDVKLVTRMDDTVVDDPSTGRTWTRGCVPIERLPPDEPWTAEDMAVSLGLVPPSMRTEAQRALASKREALRERMCDAVDAFVRRVNADRLAGHADWRLPTLEEAMSLTRPELRRGGLHLPEEFSDHPVVRTSDGYYRPTGIDNGELGEPSIWVVNFHDANCVDVPVETPVPLRLVRTDLD